MGSLARAFAWQEAPQIQVAQQRVEARLAGQGRVLLRPSGTEPLLRVMVEGEDAALVRTAAEEIAAAVRLAAGN